MKTKLYFSIQPAFACSLILISLLLPAPIARAETYELQIGQSEISVQVYKGGTLKALGHNHIISTRDISGTVRWSKSNLQDTRFELVIPVNSFRVDDPVLRKQAGKDFTKDVSKAARRGTRKNMISNKVLDAKRFPRIILSSKSITQTDKSQYDVTVDLKIHGTSKTLTVPVVFGRSSEVINIKGNFSLLQSNFGIKPLSAALGTIVVKDKIDIRFLLVAKRLKDRGEN